MLFLNLLYIVGILLMILGSLLPTGKLSKVKPCRVTNQITEITEDKGPFFSGQEEETGWKYQ